MVTSSLFALVFILGLRHGLDADHLACIDGLIRYNWKMKHSVAKYVGTLFSLGHGLVVTGVAVLLGKIGSHVQFPDWLERSVGWISIVSLFLIGWINMRNLLKIPDSSDEFQLSGLKSKWIPKQLNETSNPFLILLIGALFAVASDTISQTSVWALAASNQSHFLCIWLGIVFLLGMMLTDTIDSLLVYRMIAKSGSIGQQASRTMGWAIVFLAFSVSFYEIMNLFFPFIDVNVEAFGAAAFGIVFICYSWLGIRSRLARQAQSPHQ